MSIMTVRLVAPIFIFALFLVSQVKAGPIGPQIFKKVSLRFGHNAPEFSISGIKVSSRLKSYRLVHAVEQKYKNHESSPSPIIENFNTEAFIKNDYSYNHYGFADSGKKNLRKEKPWKKILVQIDEKLSRQKNKGKEIPRGYDPNNKDLLQNFKNDDDLASIVSQVANNKNKAKSDDLVFYDYGSNASKKEDKVVIDSIQHVASAPIPEAVRAAIRREIGPSALNPGKPIKNYQAHKTLAQVANLLSPKKDKVIENGGGVRITASEFDLGLGLKNDHIGFQFKSPYNENPIADKMGEIELEGTTGVVRGTIVKHGVVATKIELPLGDAHQKIYNIPLLTYDSVRNFLDKYEIDGRGGMYLADVSDKIEDVDIESVGNGLAYERRVFLDDNLKEVKVGADFRYILFIGVLEGNATVKVLSHHGETTEKITLITPDEILFDHLDLSNSATIDLELRIKNTMGSVTGLLNLSKENISDFITGKNPKKISAGKYQISRNTSVLGMKKYLELNYLSDKIYIGIDRSQKLEVPSNEFVLEVVRQFAVENSGLLNRCLLQVNLTKETLSLDYALESENGDEQLEVIYLDKDGTFSDTISPMTKRAFLLGNIQGVINLRATNRSNEINHMRTYCSSSTYLLEHL